MSRDEEKFGTLWAASRDSEARELPGLATRVLATFDAGKARHQVRFWKSVALVSSVLSFTSVLIVGLLLGARWGSRPAELATSASVGRAGRSQFELLPGSYLLKFPTGEPVSLQLGLGEGDVGRVVSAEVELPPGVQFLSGGSPTQERAMTVAFQRGDQPKSIPLTVSATASGRKVIRVRYFDEKGKLVSEKPLDVEFAP